MQTAPHPLHPCVAGGERCDAGGVDIELAASPPRKRLLAGKEFESATVAEGCAPARRNDC